MSSMNSCTPNLPDISVTDAIPAQEGEERDRWAGPALPVQSGFRIRDQMDPANSAVIAFRGVQAQLDERLAAADDDETLIAAAERLRTVASAVEADIYQVRNRSNQDPLNFPIKVNNRLANLLSMSERGDGRPGSGMYAVFEIMVERLEGLLGELEGVWSGELEEVNEVFRGMGVGVGEIVVGASRVAMGESARNPDVTLGLKEKGS